MWPGGGQPGDSGGDASDVYRRSSLGSSPGDNSSPQDAAAAAFAARMALAPTAGAGPSYFDMYGADYHARLRELEYLQQQRQMHEQQQAYENEARSRMLEQAAHNQIQEYERRRMQMELMNEMHMREAEYNASRGGFGAPTQQGQHPSLYSDFAREDFSREVTMPSNNSNSNSHQKEEKSPSISTEKIASPETNEAVEPSSSSKTPAQVKSNKDIIKANTPKSAPKKRKTPAKKASEGGKTKKSRASTGKKGKASDSPASVLKRKPGVPSLDDAVPDITDAEYENVQALMTEFCKVPFLAEFSRPVSLLHPEMITLYSKIVHHPMDLGHVCRAIRRREYKNTRAIQLDVWRVFSNCIKFHTHPSNKDNAIPSFISIANHLLDFFNNLWIEFMLPSDSPSRAPGTAKNSYVHAMYQKRLEVRKQRLLQLSSTALSSKCLQKVVNELDKLLSSGGMVDKLDSSTVLEDANNASGDVLVFIHSVKQFTVNIGQKLQNNDDYTVLELHRDLKKCYTEDVFEDDLLKKMKIGLRIDRILGKVLAPVHEVSCRGVNQSSIWGCMAAAIWARESRHKPYWPAIVLGILAPEEQKEDWHKALTERNEKRLPEKLLDDLKAAKKRAESGLSKKNSDQMSYFLVEFMGSHEFIWVKENAILENFDPNDDPNVAHAAGNITKKKRSTSYNAKQMDAALEEGKWALEEFEAYLNDTCGDQSDEEDEYNDAGYTYDVLCQTDEEAEALNEIDLEHENESDIEEQSEMLASEGYLDFSIAGRKLAKQRAAARKKQNAALAKKEKEKEKEKEKKAKSVSVDANTPLDDKRGQRELEARRKKRSRDHEKGLKEVERKARKRDLAAEKKSSSNEVRNKKGRAENIVKSFLLRKSMDDTNFNGPLFGPGTSIDPSGLLGMALAFRAAAGEIPFEDSNGKPFVENSWEKIDADEPLESSERCKRLEEQIALIEKEIARVNAATERRLALTEEAEKRRDAARAKIFSEGDTARNVDVKVRARKGKAGRKSSEGGGDSRPSSMPTEGAINELDVVKSEADSKIKVEVEQKKVGDVSEATVDKMDTKIGEAVNDVKKEEVAASVGNTVESNKMDVEPIKEENVQ
eukprot:scaffold9079_cov145-Skeletonema_menzelii.AAC.4